MLGIRRVVLFKHGVGYFERQGEVDGDESIDLSFKSDEMNDVLKSLTVLDLGQGHIASISYESTLPTEKRLEDIALRLPDDTTLSGLVEQVKGARVAVEIGGERIEGVVLGIESQWKKVRDETLHSREIVLLVEGGSVRHFELLEVKRLTFLEESLKKDLGHLLEVLISAKKKDLKRLTIFARGTGRRSVMASYVVETPVWKTSYRVILSQEKPFIQGWALVDNTQDEDWDDVGITLVAGLPVSFVHDLYSPRYRRRPRVEVREEEAYAPPMLEEAVASAGYAVDQVRAGAPPPPPMAARAPAPAGMPAPPAGPRARPATMAQSAPVQTRTVQVGDLFQYVIDKPVTVKRGQSALVPILAATFSGKRVAVYNREIRDKNPMSAIWFENTTGMTLEGGPLTVIENDSYVGESMLETLKPDEKRLVPYSVELGCVISIDHQSHVREVFRARIANGTLQFGRYRLVQTIYRVLNKNDATLDLFLEHRLNGGHVLVDTPKPVETTENFYRFRFDAKGKTETLLTVTERGEQWEHHSIANVTNDQISAWVSSRFIDAATHAALGEISRLNARSLELKRQIEDRERDVQRIHENQKRLRENLQALGNRNDEQRLRERYVSELTREEDLLAQLSAMILQAQREKEQVDAALRARVAGVQSDVSF
jgi:hypothetical protein